MYFFNHYNSIYISISKGEIINECRKIRENVYPEGMSAGNAVLTGEFKGTDAVGIMFRQMVRVATTELTFAWIMENDEAVIEMIPETFRSSTVPAFGGAFCSNQRADDWQAFIQAHADKLPGYERSLAQTVESIQLCAAIKQAKGNELVAAFEDYKITWDKEYIPPFFISRLWNVLFALRMY